MLFLGEAVTLAENSLHCPAGQKHVAIVDYSARRVGGNLISPKPLLNSKEEKVWCFDVNLTKASPVSVEPLDKVASSCI